MESMAQAIELVSDDAPMPPPGMELDTEAYDKAQQVAVHDKRHVYFTWLCYCNAKPEYCPTHDELWMYWLVSGAFQQFARQTRAKYFKHCS